MEAFAETVTCIGSVPLQRIWPRSEEFKRLMRRVDRFGGVCSMLYLSSSCLTSTPLTSHKKEEFRVVLMLQLRVRGAPTLTTEVDGVTVMFGEAG